jgi:hypothetical protein
MAASTMRLRALVGRSGAGGAVMRAVPRIASPSAVAPCAAPRQLAPVRCAQPGAFIAHAPRRIADGGGRRRAAGVVRAAETEAALPEWEEDFDLLSTKIKEITDELQDTDMKGCSVILVGMMGCGKSTLGRMLSNTLAYSLKCSCLKIEVGRAAQRHRCCPLRRRTPAQFHT